MLASWVVLPFGGCPLLLLLLLLPQCAGRALGVQGTPSFAVGSVLAVGTGKLQQVVEAELAKAG